MCCGAGGPEIFWGPGAGAEIFFKYTCSAVSLEDARTKKSSFFPLIVITI